MVKGKDATITFTALIKTGVKLAIHIEMKLCFCWGAEKRTAAITAKITNNRREKALCKHFLLKPQTSHFKNNYGCVIGTQGMKSE